MEIIPTSPTVGAEILGVDLANLSDGEFDTIHAAFVEHGVVFFRDQDLTPDEHLAFAQRWGGVNVNRFFTPVESHPEIAEVRKEPDQSNNIGGAWHTDHTYDVEPAMASVLYAREVPPVGGDTMYSSSAAAFDALSDAMKDTLLGLRAEHTNRIAFGQVTHKGRIGNPELAVDDAVHPVVIEHPLSGRPTLYVNLGFTQCFEGWTVEESRPLLQFLYAHCAKPEFTTRFQWRQGSMAVWDNRATQHNALNDYAGHRRLMHRVTIEGVPLAPARAA